MLAVAEKSLLLREASKLCAGLKMMPKGSVIVNLSRIDLSSQV